MSSATKISGGARLGALVIGQSPRPDVVRELREVLGEDIDIDLRGALDGLSREEIDQLNPCSDADALFTHLPDGDNVTISKRAVVKHGERTLQALVTEGFSPVVVMCTGAFPDWMGKYPVIFPSLVLEGFVRALMGQGGASRAKLGVFVPLNEQIEPLGARWRALGIEVHMECLTPTSGPDAIDAAAGRMQAVEPSLLVYDCLSYNQQTKRRVEARTGVPGVLAVSAAARTAQELLSGQA